MKLELINIKNENLLLDLDDGLNMYFVSNYNLNKLEEFKAEIKSKDEENYNYVKSIYASGIVDETLYQDGNFSLFDEHQKFIAPHWFDDNGDLITTYVDNREKSKVERLAIIADNKMRISNLDPERQAEYSEHLKMYNIIESIVENDFLDSDIFKIIVENAFHDEENNTINIEFRIISRPAMNNYSLSIRSSGGNNNILFNEFVQCNETHLITFDATNVNQDALDFVLNCDLINDEEGNDSGLTLEPTVINVQSYFPEITS